MSGQSLEGDFRKEGVQVRASYDAVTEVFQTGSAVIYDSVVVGYGVVVSEDGLILVKTSEFEKNESSSVVVGKKRFHDFLVVASSPEWDVTMIKVEAEGLEPVDYAEGEPEHGSIVLSNSASTRFRRRAQLGVMAANARAVGEELLAVLGIVMEGGEGEAPLKVVAISPNSGARDAGLKKGDLIVSLEGVEVETREEVPQVLEGRSPGEFVTFVVSREMEREESKELIEVEDPFAFAEENPPVDPEYEELTFEVELRERQVVFPERLTRNDMLTGRFSERRSNFPRVLQHDTSLSPRSTGGPLITLDGKCVGMNIAYASRECSYAIPALELQELVSELKAEAGL